MKLSVSLLLGLSLCPLLSSGDSAFGLSHVVRVGRNDRRVVHGENLGRNGARLARKVRRKSRNTLTPLVHPTLHTAPDQTLNLVNTIHAPVPIQGPVRALNLLNNINAPVPSFNLVNPFHAPVPSLNHVNTVHSPLPIQEPVRALNLLNTIRAPVPSFNLINPVHAPVTSLNHVNTIHAPFPIQGPIRSLNLLNTINAPVPSFNLVNPVHAPVPSLHHVNTVHFPAPSLNLVNLSPAPQVFAPHPFGHFSHQAVHPALAPLPLAPTRFVSPALNPAHIVHAHAPLVHARTHLVHSPAHLVHAPAPLVPVHAPLVPVNAPLFPVHAPLAPALAPLAPAPAPLAPAPLAPAVISARDIQPFPSAQPLSVAPAVLRELYAAPAVPQTVLVASVPEPAVVVAPRQSYLASAPEPTVVVVAPRASYFVAEPSVQVAVVKSDVKAATRSEPIAILRSVLNAPDSIFAAKDGWDYSFESANGIKQEAVGTLRIVDDIAVSVMKGSYEFIGADGVVYAVKWYADETGFHATAPHLPRSVEPNHPEVAAAVRAQIAFAAAEDRDASASGIINARVEVPLSNYGVLSAYN